MKNSKLWKRPYHSGIDWSAENEAKAFGYSSRATFVEDITRRISEDKVRVISFEELQRMIDNDEKE